MDDEEIGSVLAQLVGRGPLPEGDALPADETPTDCVPDDPLLVDADE